MKNIFDEVRCIENLQKEIEFDLFKYESKYKNELEILILGYYANLLKLAKLPFPIYFEKRNNQYPPDFNIFDSKKDLIKYVEVTECLKPSRRRQQEYRNSESRNQNEYSLENLDGLLIRLNKKFLSQYSNTDLIIWINVDIFDVASCGVWHRIIVNRINEWIQRMN